MKQNWRKRKEMGGDKGKLKGEKAVLRLLSSRIHGSLYIFRRSNRPIISRASLSLVLDRTPAQASSPTSRRKRRSKRSEARGAVEGLLGHETGHTYTRGERL